MKKQHDPRYFKPYSGVECIFPAYKSPEKVEAQKKDQADAKERPETNPQDAKQNK